MPREDVEIDCKLVRETAGAMLIDNGRIQAWIPKSQISDEGIDNKVLYSIFIPQWLAEEKGLV